MGRCYICDFCDDFIEYESHDCNNFVLFKEEICNECATFIGVSLMEFELEEKISLGNSWRSDTPITINKKPKEQKGSRQGTKKAMYPQVPAGSYNHTKGRVVFKDTEKGSTEAVTSSAIGVAPPSSEGTPEPTVGLGKHICSQCQNTGYKDWNGFCLDRCDCDSS